MQALARDGLSDAEVTALLQADNLSISAGCELLAADLSFVEDISGDLESGTIQRSCYADVHGTCSLRLVGEDGPLEALELEGVGGSGA